MAQIARKIATLALTGTVAATAIAPAAQAGERYREWERVRVIERNHVRPRHREPVRKYRRVHRRHDNDTGAAIALGIGAIALGAIIAGSANSQPAPVYRQRDYYPPRPAYRTNRVVTYSAVEPWTAAWYDYCADRYRSFNPSTGTFRGYDGLDHFCVAR